MLILVIDDNQILLDMLRPTLLRHTRQVLPHERILETVWGYDFEGDDNVLEVYIGYLRKKTETAVSATEVTICVGETGAGIPEEELTTHDPSWGKSQHGC